MVGRNNKSSLRTYAILFFCILCFTLTSCGEPETYMTTDINEYMQLDGHIVNESREDYDTGLFIFPKSLEQFSHVDYMHYCEEGILDNTYAIYLKGYYKDVQQFNDEIERLADITCTIEHSEKTVTNKIEYNETLFGHPAYISIYDTNICYEYALIDDANKSITYVFFTFLFDMDVLNSECLPKEIREAGEFDYDTSWKKLNIYYAPYKDEGYVYYTGDKMTLSL